jgi:serine/threonine protein kinase
MNRSGARYCASCQTPLGVVAAKLQQGQLLDDGRYRVVRALGKGGMGAVWLVAQTRAFDRLAVLKEVVEYFDPTDAEEREKAAQRFEAEARTLGDLKHPGIPDLYDWFSDGGHNYLVMEYIEGLDLRKGLTRQDSTTGQLVSGGPRPAEDVVRYASQICEVLEYLSHRQPPVVHNDIKPGNIIIDEHSKRAVLVDFGTAKTRYLRTSGQPDGSKDSLYGTVGYAAPELYHGRSEPRSDVYSLAATGYHLLTDDDPRDHPFQYPLLDTLPPVLTGILRAALAEELAERPTAAEFRQKLDSYLAGQTGPLRVLTFPDGDAADERDELLTLAVKHWHYAAGILQDGTIAQWLRRTLHDPVAAQAAERAVQQAPNDPDAALDAFIPQLNPGALPPGKLELRTSIIRLVGAGANQRITQKIELVNRGRGFVRGEVLSTQPWVKTASTFACPPGQVCTVPVEVDTTGLPVGFFEVAAVTLTPAGGAPEVVPVQLSVGSEAASPVQTQSGPPRVEIRPRRVDFGTVSPGDLSTARVGVAVTNVGGTAAQVRVVDVPGWLLVKPGTFGLAVDARQVVEFVGRVDKVQGRKQKVKVTFALDGGRNQEIEVRLQVKRRGLFG